MTPIERAPTAQWTTHHRQVAVAAPFAPSDVARPNTVSPPFDSSVPTPKPYSDIIKGGHKRSKSNPDDDKIEVFGDNPKRRRTKADARREEALMNTASEKLERLAAENIQLKLHLQQASRDAAMLKAALGEERQVSSKLEASNQALRLLLLKERVNTELRNTNVPYYTAIDETHSHFSPSSVVPSHNQTERSGLAPLSEVTLETERLRRGSTKSGDLLRALEENHHSQLLVKRLLAELDSNMDERKGSWLLHY